MLQSEDETLFFKNYIYKILFYKFYLTQKYVTVIFVPKLINEFY